MWRTYDEEKKTLQGKIDTLQDRKLKYIQVQKKSDGKTFKELQTAITKIQEKQIVPLVKKMETLVEEEGKGGQPIGLDMAGTDPAIRKAYAVRVQEEFARLSQQGSLATIIGNGIGSLATSDGLKKFAKGIAGPVTIGAVAGGMAYGAAYAASATALAPYIGIGLGSYVAIKALYKRWVG